MNCRFALVAALAVASLAVASLAAIPLRGQATASALSLNGVRKVTLRFLLTEDDIAAGVDTTRLRGTIENRLRARSIALIPGRSGGDGTVGVNVGAIRSTTSASVTFFYYLDFRQQVKVARLPDPPFPPIPAVTWTSVVSFGDKPGDRFLAHLDDVTTQLMDAFLLDHQKGQDAVKR